ncbi:hypothetical protein AwWohl_07890 [Gammaproteobacteria bacterium]|nr:hypothetical protein AwWohl_07890 [Gammaproteobacteria bacterium]
MANYINILKINTLIIVLILNCLNTLYADDFESAVKAYDEEDYNLAFNIFEALAEKGHIDALNNIGTMLQIGRGTPRDYVRSVESYRIAAAEGHIDAALNLSTLYRLGIGVYKDLAEAHAWALVAARHGNSEAVSIRDSLKQMLKPEERDLSDTAAKSYLEYLAPSELPLAWLIPYHLKEDMPEEYAQYMTEKTMLLPQQGYYSPKPTQVFKPLTTPIPEGFSAITPSGVKQNIATPDNPNNTKSTNDTEIFVPPGFSAIRPKQAQTNSNQNSPKGDLEQNVSIISPKTGISQVLDASSLPQNENENEDEEEIEAPAAKIIKKTLYSNLTSIEVMPAQMSLTGETQYRVSSIPLKYNLKNATLLRPRRVIPVRISPVFDIEIDTKLQPMIRSLANTNRVSEAQIVSALKIANPNAFEQDQPLRLVSEDEPLIIPLKADILKAPILSPNF